MNKKLLLILIFILLNSLTHVHSHDDKHEEDECPVHVFHESGIIHSLITIYSSDFVKIICFIIVLFFPLVRSRRDNCHNTSRAPPIPLEKSFS